MADILLRVNGDAGGGVDATRNAGKAVEDLGRASVDASKKSAEEVAKATVKWAAYADAAKAALKAVVDFGVASVKAYAESERVSRQLERAAGDLADVFEAQADALSKTLAVDDDLIKQQQTLLLQWGAAPAQVEGATRAVLDYAAATGKDALTATTELIKGVETGGEKFKSLGIQYVATGDKTKDLAALTEALSKKFGGAAKADADSLVGSARGAELAFEDLQKAFGAFIADAGQKTGVVAALTEAMRGLQTAMGGNEEYNRNQAKGKLYDEMSAIQRALNDPSNQWNTGVSREQATSRLAELQSQLAASAAPTLPSTSTGTTKFGEEKKAKAAGADYWTPGSAARLGGELDEQGGPTSLWARGEEREREKYLAELQRTFEEVEKAEAANEEKRKKGVQDYLEYKAKAESKAVEDSMKAEQEAREKLLAQQQQWARAGDQMGAALVNSITKQMERLADGGDVDMQEMMTDIMVAVVGIAATAVGSYFGAPQVGASIGNLAGVGIKYATKKNHDGGWSGVERYHSGGWLGADEEPAILQHGERVLSRTEVSRMGGQASVDAAARGSGRGVTINVTALDAKSASEAFEDQTGRGFWRAIQSGHGDVARLFGEGVL